MNKQKYGQIPLPTVDIIKKAQGGTLHLVEDVIQENLDYLINNLDELKALVGDVENLEKILPSNETSMTLTTSIRLIYAIVMLNVSDKEHSLNPEYIMRNFN